MCRLFISVIIVPSIIFDIPAIRIQTIVLVLPWEDAACLEVLDNFLAGEGVVFDNFIELELLFLNFFWVVIGVIGNGLAILSMDVDLVTREVVWREDEVLGVTISGQGAFFWFLGDAGGYFMGGWRIRIWDWSFCFELEIVIALTDLGYAIFTFNAYTHEGR
jgi:hypothetical protein